MRKAAYIAAMWLLGAAVMAALAALVQWREGQPIADTGATPGAATRSALPALTQGVARSAAASIDGLQEGRRGEAMHALNGVEKTVHVGHEAADGVVRWAFAHAVTQMEDARVALHLGQPRAATRHLDEIVLTMRAVAARAEGQATAVPRENQWDAYTGATLLNANGARIGEVESLRSAGGDIEARLRVGGVEKLLGLIDWGGRSLTVPADSLLFGPPRFPGVTMVVLPVSESDPADIVAGAAPALFTGR